MGLVRPLLAMKVSLGVASLAAAAGSWVLVRGRALRHEALHAGPGFDQRAVDREVLAGEELAHLRQAEHAGHELARDVAVQEPVAVLAEHRGLPHLLVHRQPPKPAYPPIV